MDLLLQKYNDYMRLVGCKVKYELIDGTVIEVVYREDNFLHLLGIHNVVDIQLIQFWLDRTNRTVKLMDVIKGIKNGKLKIGPKSYINNGKWLWPGDLAYYVENYDLQLPNEFIEYMKEKEWKVPDNLDIDFDELEVR